MLEDNDDYDLHLLDAASLIATDPRTIIEWSRTGRPGLGVLPARETTEGSWFRLADLVAFAAADVPPHQRRGAADFAAAVAGGMRGARKWDHVPLSDKAMAVLDRAFGLGPATNELATRSTGLPSPELGFRFYGLLKEQALMQNIETEAEMHARHTRERAELSAAKKKTEHAEDTRLVAWLRKARPAEHAALLATCDAAVEAKRRAAAERKAKSRAADVTPAPVGVTSASNALDPQVVAAPQAGSWEA